jgi:hypothetical protein
LRKVSLVLCREFLGENILATFDLATALRIFVQRSEKEKASLLALASYAGILVLILHTAGPVTCATSEGHSVSASILLADRWRIVLQTWDILHSFFFFAASSLATGLSPAIGPFRMLAQAISIVHRAQLDM